MNKELPCHARGKAKKRGQGFKFGDTQSSQGEHLYGTEGPRGLGRAVLTAAVWVRSLVRVVLVLVVISQVTQLSCSFRLRRSFSPGSPCTSPGAKSGDILDCHNLGGGCATGIARVQARAAAEHPTNTQEGMIPTCQPCQGRPPGTPSPAGVTPFALGTARKGVTTQKRVICSLLGVLLFTFGCRLPRL